MKNVVEETKSLKGSRNVAWAIICFNMEQLAHHHKGSQIVVYDMAYSLP
jgi:hypothetical protein